MTPQAGDEPSSEGRIKDAALAGIRWQALARVVGEASLVVSTVALARLVPPPEVGHAVIALTVSAFAMATGGVGLASAIVQRSEVTRRHLEVGTLINVVVGVFLTIVLVLAPPALSPIFGTKAADLVRLISPLPLLVGIAAVPTALAQRKLRFRLNSLAAATAAIVGAVTAVSAAAAGLDAPALVLGALGGRASLMLVMILAVRPVMPRWHSAEAREIIGFGAPAGLSSVLWVGFQNVDFAIIAARMAPTQVGLYYRGFAFGVSYPWKVSQVVVELLFPIYSRLRARNRLKQIRTRIVRIHAIVIFPLIAGYIALAPVLIPWLLGSQWKGLVTPSQILAVGGLVTTLMTGTGPLLLAVGRPGLLLGWNLGGLIAYAAAVFFTTPLGLIAVCVAVASVFLLQLFVAYVFLLPLAVGIGGIRDLPGEAGPAAVSSAVALTVGALLAHWLHRTGISAPITICIAGAACATTYILVLQRLFRGAWQEFSRIAARVLPGRKRTAASVEAEALEHDSAHITEVTV